MRILWGPSCMLITVYLCTTTALSTNIDDDCDDESVNTKISATLKIDNETLKSVPENSERMEYDVEFQKKSEKRSDVVLQPKFDATNSTRSNNTRKLSSAISMEQEKPNVDENLQDTSEKLPEAQELRQYERPGKRRRPYRPYTPRKSPIVNRRNVFPETARPPLTRLSRRPTDPKRGPTAKECTFFTKTVCLKAVDYPLEAIMRSIRSNKEMITALLTDYVVQESGTAEDELHKQFLNKYEDSQENKYGNRFESNELKRRYDYPFENVEEGFTCPSKIEYARPQLARAASGIWKYIINTDEHTQTLRLEKCSNSQSSCSFISENYRSSCAQVYNYHRLLTWDAKLGLHMDIFKVPTCCTCHVHGYAEIYPPHQKDPSSRLKENFPGADFAITDQKNDFEEVVKPSNHVNKYSPSSYFDTSLDFYNEHSPSSLASEETFPLTKSKTSLTDFSQNRSAYSIPGRRFKKPASISRPYDKVPQQHAPNTRAPGYTGSLTKNIRSNRPNRPFRRESTFDMEEAETGNNTAFVNRYSRPHNREENPTTKKENGHIDETQRRVNFNYHPILEFFTPHASRLQSAPRPENQQPSSTETNSNLWKPIISS